LEAAGSITLRAVHPVFADGSLAGYVELAKNIDDILRLREGYPGQELALTIRKERLNQTNWVTDRREQGLSADWETLPRNVVVYASQAALSNTITAWVNPVTAPARSEAAWGVNAGGKHWRIASTPLRDIAGQEIGDLLAMLDVTAARADFIHRIVLGAAAAAVVLTLVLGFLYVLLRRADAGIRAQQASLQSSEAHLSATLQSIGDGVIACDAGGNVVLLNVMAEKFTGWSNDEARGRPIAGVCRIIHAETRQAVEIPVGRALREDRIIGLANHTVLIARDGAELQIADSCAPIHDVAGGLLGAVLVFRDVTEEYARQMRLRQLSNAVEQSPTSTVITNLAGDIEYVNPRFAEVSGYTREEVLGRNPRFLQSGHISPETYRELWGAITAGKTWRGLFHNKKKNGELYWEDTAISPILDPSGRITHFLGVKEDITRRLQTEAALRDNEANFRTFFESSVEVVLVAALDGRIMDCNSAATSALGYRAEELAAMHLHPASQRQEAEEIFAAILRGERNRCPLPLALRDGSQVPVETRFWFGQWNGADCLFCTSRNLTAEQEAQQRFETLFRHSPAPMTLALLPERRFSDVNDAFQRRFGYSRAEIIGKTAVELDLFVHSEQRTAVVDQLRTAGRVTDLEAQVRHKDGTILDNLFSAEMIRIQGQSYVLGVSIDI
ncbi:MAG: PAS domain S-box protein, partial [Verrucomicrobia bacterium]|nr:PAS domain S-box protein [Verrucomicrobiota bacterium]